MVNFVIGSGDKRVVVAKADNGKDLHQQRRALKQYLGLLRP